MTIMPTTDTIDQVISLALAESFGPTWLSQNNQVILPDRLRLASHDRPAPWSPMEKEYLRQNIGLLTDEEIGAVLGRSTNAIKIKRTRYGLPAHSKRPGWLTGNQVARILNVDIHCILELHRRQLIPFYVVPGQRGILNIHRTTFYRWAINPENWIYFRHDRITDPHLARLLQLKEYRWGDRWWTTAQVAEFFGVKQPAVDQAILRGKLPSKKWSRHFVKRSVALQHPFMSGSGYGHEKHWTLEGDQFILLSSAIGLSVNHTAILNGTGFKSVGYRVRSLLDHPQLTAILTGLPIPVQIDHERRNIFADWRLVAHRYPYLANAVNRFHSGQLITLDQAWVIRYLLSHWLDWYQIDCTRWFGKTTDPAVYTRKLATMHQALQSRGLDPLPALG